MRGSNTFCAAGGGPRREPARRGFAKTYGTTAHAFSTAFSASIGLSPKEYIHRRLNQEAIQLVLNTDLKVKKIADKLRFSSEFHFSRFFKTFNGVSPSRYRQRFRTGV